LLNLNALGTGYSPCKVLDFERWHTHQKSLTLLMSFGKWGSEINRFPKILLREGTLVALPEDREPERTLRHVQVLLDWANTC
jgi:hypothetical protein